MKTLFDYDLTLEEAEKLIRNGADVNETDIYGATPLFYVTDIDIARLLIHSSADVNIKDDCGYTALFQRKSIDIIKLLIEHGADTNIIIKTGYPLFYDFQIYHQIDILNKFLQAGADPNYLSPSGTLISMAHRGLFISKESIALIRGYGGIASDIQTYQSLQNLFSTEQQHAFNAFASITSNDAEFFQMCLAYQTGLKNHAAIDVKDMDIL